MPRQFGPLLGDAVHNLRSSLDAIAYALATKNLRRSPTASEASSIQFPIVEHESAWPKKEKRWLSHLSAPVREEIFKLQPFNQKTSNWGERLVELRDLSNSDKHRRVNVLLASPEMTAIMVKIDGQPEFAVPNAHYGVLEVGTEIGRWSFVPGFVSPDSKLSMRPVIEPGVAFDPNVHGHGDSVTHFLGFVHNAIRDHIFPPLDVLLS